MYFKFSILLLFFIIAAPFTKAGLTTGAQRQIEDRIIKDLFNDCLKRFIENERRERTVITMDHFMKYMDKSDENLKIMHDFFEKDTKKKREDYDILNLKRFEEIFEHYCNSKHISLQDYADDRKEAITKYSFNDCLKWLRYQEDRTVQDYMSVLSESHITSDQFLKYMVISHPEDIAVINKYFDDCPEAMENKENIGLKLYSELVKHYCEIHHPEYTLKRCIDMRKSAL